MDVLHIAGVSRQLGVVDGADAAASAAVYVCTFSMGRPGPLQSAPPYASVQYQQQ